MKQFKLKNSPIVYYVSKANSDDYILFIHAAFVDHRMFKEQLEYFKNKKNIILLDILGHGKSTDTKKGDSIETMSFWINEILKNEKINKVDIVGVSIGSILAQDFANSYPNKLKSLISIGGYDINNFDKNMQKENSSKQIFMMLRAMFSIKWFADKNKEISAYTSKAKEDFYKMNIEFPRKSFKYLASLNKMINVYKTSKREYPILIGCGEYDTPMALTAIEIWKDNEPNCIVKIFENAGHCVNMDISEKFNKVIENFWQKTR